LPFGMTQGVLAAQERARELSHHDLSYRGSTVPRHLRTSTGYRGLLHDTTAMSHEARERNARVTIDKESRESPACVSTKVHTEARAAVFQREYLPRSTTLANPNEESTATTFGRNHGATQQYQSGNQQMQPAHHPYLPASRSHRRSNYQFFSPSTAMREAQIAGRTKSPAGFTELPNHREAAWAPSSSRSEVHLEYPADDTHDDTAQDHSTWACPGRLGPVCFNYHDTPSADHVDGGHLLHMHSSSGHPLSPGASHPLPGKPKVNRTKLLAPGSRALKDSEQLYNY